MAAEVFASEVAIEKEKQKKLESNYSIYIKIAEREFLSKNFKNAIKNFKNVR